MKTPEDTNDRAELADVLSTIRSAPRRKNSKSMIDVCRKILNEQQCARWHGDMIDSFSASAFVKIFDLLPEEGRVKLLAIADSKGPAMAMRVVWKMVG